MTEVIFIQHKFPKNIKDFTALIDRWGSYLEKFNQVSKGSSIKLFSTHEFSDVEISVIAGSLIQEVGKYKNSYGVIRRTLNFRKSLRNSKTSKVLVCGDIQVSFLIALFLKKTSRAKVSIQVQFHGDTYTYSANRGISGLIRVTFSRFAIHFSDSIRIVSQFQQSEITNIDKSSSNKFIVAPIPLDLGKVPTISPGRDIDILVVGRLHTERGIDEMVMILNELSMQSRELRVAIVGDGPLKSFIKETLTQKSQFINVCFLGTLDSDELSKIYARSKVLLSSAPSEGYGLTLREAALSSVFVVARRSKGVHEAKADFPEIIFEYDSHKSAIQLISDIIVLPSQNINTGNRKLQENRDSQALLNLFQSWDDLS